MDYSAEQRREWAETGVALPDGSYPIPDCAALSDAIAAYGRETGDRATLRHHIARRKAALGCPGVDLPETWRMERA